ncbi:MAG: hypothetical protein FWC78_04690 [Defluviitaleaceae bacterium]|nr:hypothetical protein [Defluviitaleaceae bacterium]
MKKLGKKLWHFISAGRIFRPAEICINNKILKNFGDMVGKGSDGLKYL